jgi:dTDP-4-amino-4,6-dideoxygalactose transaminase
MSEDHFQARVLIKEAAENKTQRMQSAIGLAELDRMDTWNLPRRRRNAHIILDALQDERLIKVRPIDTPERQNAGT